MLRMMWSICGVAQSRSVVFQGLAGIVVIGSCIATSAFAQVTTGESGPNQALTPPRNLIAPYTPPQRIRQEPLTWLVAPEEPAQVSVTNTAGNNSAPSPAPPAVAPTTTGVRVGDRIDGPAINTLAVGHSAITVSAIDGPR